MHAIPPGHLTAITPLIAGFACEAIVEPGDFGWALVLAGSLRPIGFAVVRPRDHGLWRIVMDGDDAYPHRFPSLRAAAVAALGERLNIRYSTEERERHEHHPPDDPA